MAYLKPRKEKRTLSRSFLLLTLLVCLPILIFLVFSNVYTLSHLDSQAVDLTRESLTIYQNSVDAQLGSYNAYLIDFFDNNVDIVKLVQSEEEGTSLLARIRMQNRFIQTLGYYKGIYGLFAYDVKTQKEAYAFQTQETFVSRGLMSHIEQSIAEEAIENSADWTPYVYNDQLYMIRLLRTNTLYCGAIIEAQAYLPSSSEKSDYLVLSSEGEVLTNLDQSYLEIQDISTVLNEHESFVVNGSSMKMVGVPSEHGSYILASIIHANSGLLQLDLLQQMTIVVTVLFVLMLIFQRWYQGKYILRPLRIAVDAMKKVGAGQLETHIDSDPDALAEFQLVNHTFNHMISEIKQLKINVYEEKANRQKAALQFLQLQNKPHFFANALQIIKALVEMRKYDEISYMIDRIAQYMRYTLSGSKSVVTLLDEYNHVESYLEMARYSKHMQHISFHAQIAPNLLHYVVPPLIIQTFVENTIHYSRIAPAQVEIIVHCSLISIDNEQWLRIEINDNGCGFPEGVLKMHSQEGRIIDERGERIGIHNITSRLQILFDGRASICLSNKEKGAHIVIQLPAIEEEVYDNIVDRR